MQVGAARAQKATGAGVAGLGWVLGSRHDAVSTRRHTMAANSQRLSETEKQAGGEQAWKCHCSSVRPRDRLDSVHQCAPVCAYGCFPTRRPGC